MENPQRLGLGIFLTLIVGTLISIADLGLLVEATSAVATALALLLLWVGEKPKD